MGTPGLRSTIGFPRTPKHHAVRTLGGSFTRRLAAFAFVDDGFVKASAEGFGEFVDLVISVDFNGLLGGVQDHVAVVAPMQVLFQFGANCHADGAIQIVGQLF